jgi:hypothetical protein
MRSVDDKVPLARSSAYARHRRPHVFFIASVARPDNRGICGGATKTMPAQARRRGVWQPHPRHYEDDEADGSFLAVRL